MGHGGLLLHPRMGKNWRNGCHRVTTGLKPLMLNVLSGDAFP
jgi:hypothetical protein